MTNKGMLKIKGWYPGEVDKIKKIDWTMFAQIEGTEKQIEYAEDIRACVIACIGVDWVLKNQMFINAMNKATDAKWWIEQAEEYKFFQSKGATIKRFEIFVKQ